MRFVLLVVLSLSVGVIVAQEPSASRYLVTWVGDADRADSDFLAVLDVMPGSKTFAQIIKTVPVDTKGTMPHHVEHFFSPDHTLFANGFAGNQTFRFDLGDPVKPRLVGKVADVPGLGFPHAFVRLPNGNVLATMQASGPDNAPPGGLAEFRDDGTPVRWAGAASDVDPGARPYSLVVLPVEDRIIVACGRMGIAGQGMVSALDHQGFSVELWRLSDLHLLKSIALTAPEGSRAFSNPYEPRRLPNGEVLLSSFSGGLYRITGFEAETFGAELVYDFRSAGLGVPVVVGKYWIQPVGGMGRVIALDVTNPRKPVEISRVQLDVQVPHWLALDDLTDRIVLTNATGLGDSRVWLLKMDRVSGLLSLDFTFHERGDERPGVSFDRDAWPHGRTGKGIPHGSIFVN
jgi:hypothetical protein